MLGKLIKHEFKATYTEFAILYILILAATIMLKIFTKINADNVIIALCSLLFAFLYGLAIVAGFIGSIVLILKRFYTNMTKDEAYLTFTLPVTSGQHILSKLIVSVVWLIATYAVLLVTFLIPFVDNFSPIINEIKDFIDVVNKGGYWPIVFSLVLLLLVGLFVTILQYYACIAVGQMVGKHRILGAVGAYIANGIILQVIITMLITVAARFFSALELEKVFDGMPEDKVLTSVSVSGLLAVSLFMFILCIVYFFITKVIFDRKLNLE